MRAIPLSVKSEIVRKFLEGDSIPKISKLCKVSVGTVSAITNEASEKDDYFIVIREVTTVFKKNNLEISKIILGIRLYNKIKEEGLTIPFFEDFLESTNTESFKLGMDHVKFLEEIKRIMNLEKQYSIRVADIPEYVENTKQEIEKLRKQIREVIQKKFMLYFEYCATKAEIEEYNKEKPVFLRYKFEKETFPNYFEWIIPDEVFEKANRKIKRKIDRTILYDQLHSIYRDPQHHIEIIEKIREYFKNRKQKN